jgi:hypothetical protein
MHPISSRGTRLSQLYKNCKYLSFTLLTILGALKFSVLSNCRLKNLQPKDVPSKALRFFVTFFSQIEIFTGQLRATSNIGGTIDN